MIHRAQTLRGKLPASVDAALIHNRSNMRYLSGYRGEGLVLISEQELAVVTDFRYTEQAAQEAPGFAVHETTMTHTQNMVACERLQAAGAKRVAIEQDAVTYTEYQAIAKALTGMELVSLGDLPLHMREVKDEDEQKLLAQANGLTSQCFEYMLGYIKPGVTEKQIAVEIWHWLLTHGADGLAFDTIVAAGPNGSLPHAIPSDRPVQTGDLITLDFGARYRGYCADMTRTVALGKIDSEQKKIYDTVFQAQALALTAAKAGVACKAVDAAARDFIHAAGYEGRFGHGLGHGTGLDIHEGSRCNTISTATLKAGMSMTIEPGIYIPGFCGVRIEDSVIITDTGNRIMTPATKELITI